MNSPADELFCSAQTYCLSRPTSPESRRQPMIQKVNFRLIYHRNCPVYKTVLAAPASHSQCYAIEFCVILGETFLWKHTEQVSWYCKTWWLVHQLKMEAFPFDCIALINCILTCVFSFLHNLSKVQCQKNNLQATGKDMQIWSALTIKWMLEGSSMSPETDSFAWLQVALGLLSEKLGTQHTADRNSMFWPYPWKMKQSNCYQFITHKISRLNLI